MFNWLKRKREDCVDSNFTDLAYLTAIFVGLILDIATLVFCRKIWLQLDPDARRLKILVNCAVVFVIICIVVSVIYIIVELIRMKRDWYYD